MPEFNEYFDYFQGDLPIIFSVPHGGDFLSNNIPSRKEGILGIDINTIQLTNLIIKKLIMLFENEGSVYKNPSWIMSKIHRSKIDFNRDEKNAYFSGSKLAKQLYDFYHGKLLEFIKYNLNEFSFSLLFDIHGFDKKDIPFNFPIVDIVIGTNNMQTIIGYNTRRFEWKNTIRGKIIKLFLKEGIKIAPNKPVRREYVLTGGYIVNKYGAMNIKNSMTIQIEFSDDVRMNNLLLKEKVISILADAIYQEIIRNFIQKRINWKKK
ncbi:MAG: hypothetical protein ACTSRH_03810 [Promethearchaeota archaeon]